MAFPVPHPKINVNSFLILSCPERGNLDTALSNYRSTGHIPVAAGAVLASLQPMC